MVNAGFSGETLGSNLGSKASATHEHSDTPIASKHGA
jgi:hypothetical protein